MKKNEVPLKDRFKDSFKKRFLEMLSNDSKEYEKFIQTNLLEQRKSFRINKTSKKEILEIKKRIEKKGFELEKVSFCDNGFFLKDLLEDNKVIGNTIEHFNGDIYIQEATSMTPPLALDIPKKIEDNFLVLDMCSAPGSKTTQIANMMGGKGTIIANELDYSRLGALSSNILRCNFENIIITNQNGLRIRGENVFDRILLDAPCSGSGVIRKSKKTILTYNPKKLKGMYKTQLNLLIRGFELLKNGGIITYSTCSLDYEENEKVIQDFLEIKKEAKLEKINLDIKTKYKVKKFFDDKVKKEVWGKTIRIWPQEHNVNGFFLAKIKKI